MKYEIQVKPLDEWTFQVDVTGIRTTRHRVTTDPDYYRKLTSGRISAAELVKRSFQFLLARESNSSILSSFDLKVISRYFPEYEEEFTAERYHP